MGKVILTEVRFSYPNLFTPKAVQGSDKPKYSCSFIIPKSNKKLLAKIEAELEKLKQEYLTANKLDKLPKKFFWPLQDPQDSDTLCNDEAYEDAMYVSGNSQRKPGAVDENLNPVIDPEKFFPGCYGHAEINFYLFDKGGNKGIAAGLNNVMFVRGDEEDRLGGNTSAAAAFADFA